MVTLPPQEIEFELAHWNDDKGPLVIIVTTILVVFAMTVVVLRLITRKGIIRISWQVDDYAIIVAMILALGLYTEILLSVHYGTGKHVLRVGIDNTVKILAITFALELNYVLCHLAIKVSLLSLYRAILTLHSPRFKFAWYAVGAYVLAFTVMSILVTLFQCTPIHYNWDRFSGPVQDHCLNAKAEILAPASLNTLGDVALLVLPIPTLWNLQMPLKQKLGLVVMFLLGIFACTASAIRISYIAQVEDIPDYTYTEVETLIWSLVEPCVGISCACLSTLRPMFRALHDGIQRSRHSGSKLLTKSRSIFHGTAHEPSMTTFGNSTRRWGGHSHDTPSGIDDSAVVLKGSSDIEMRGMGYNSLDTE